jgi:hypothetical protein
MIVGCRLLQGVKERQRENAERKDGFLRQCIPLLNQKVWTEHSAFPRTAQFTSTSLCCRLLQGAQERSRENIERDRGLLGSTLPDLLGTGGNNTMHF